MSNESLAPAAHGLALGEARPAQGSLKRNYLSLPELVAQSIGLVGVSGGIGVLIPAVYATAGNGTWLAYLFAMIALLFSAWSISYFARSTASPGSLYAYASQGLGRGWGVLCGWALLIAYGIGAAGILQGTVSTSLTVLHELGLVGAQSPLALILAVTALLAFAAWYITWRDIRLSTRTTLWIELGTLALILLVVGGYVLFHGPLVDKAQVTLEGVKPDQLRLGMVLAFFSFVGFESATVLGAEARDPFRQIPRAVNIGIVVPAILFILLSFGLVGAFQGAATPLDKAEAPLSILAGRLGLGWAGVLIDAGVALSFFAAFFSAINAAARVLYAFARQGLVHSTQGRAHAKNATPHVAVTFLTLFSLATALALTLDGTALLDAYGYLSSISTYGFLLAYLLVAVAAPVSLQRKGLLKPSHVLVSVIAVVLLGIPLVGSVYPVPTGLYAVLPYIFAGLLALGVLWFLALKLFSPQRLRDLEAEIAKD